MGRGITCMFVAVGWLLFSVRDLGVAPNRPQSSEHSEEARKGNHGGNQRWVKSDDEYSMRVGERTAREEKGQQS